MTTTTAQDNRLEKARVRTNKATCGALSLPPTCTQAQARAKDSNANIYSDVSDFLDRFVVKGYTDSLKTADTADDQQQFCTWWATATVSARNPVCASAGLPTAVNSASDPCCISPLPFSSGWEALTTWVSSPLPL